MTTTSASPPDLMPPSPEEHGVESADVDALRDQIIDALKTVHDPEIPVNIYDLGLVYRIDVLPAGDVEVDMTLTTPNCPVAEDIPRYAQEAVESVPGVRSATVRLVWDPPWDQSRMSEDAQMILGFY